MVGDSKLKDEGNMEKGQETNRRKLYVMRMRT